MDNDNTLYNISEVIDNVDIDFRSLKINARTVNKNVQKLLFLFRYLVETILQTCLNLHFFYAEKTIQYI